MVVQVRMKTTILPEAYCAEANCNWQGETPAIAKCPSCGSRQLRKTELNDPKVEDMVQGWIRMHGGDREAVARWMRSTLRVASISESRDLIARYGGLA